jgi:hypothetical protein
MRDWLGHKLRLRRLRKEERKTYSNFCRLIAEAKKKGKSTEDIRDLNDHWGQKSDYIEDRIALEESDYLQRRASLLDVPAPTFVEPPDGLGVALPGSENWKRLSGSNRYFLVAAARHALRQDVNAAERARREIWTWWVPIGFGAIGALTGLISVAEKGCQPADVQQASHADHAGGNSK